MNGVSEYPAPGKKGKVKSKIPQTTNMLSIANMYLLGILVDAFLNKMIFKPYSDSYF